MQPPIRHRNGPNSASPLASADSATVAGTDERSLKEFEYQPIPTGEKVSNNLSLEG